jgi:hypothetical protein
MGISVEMIVGVVVLTLLGLLLTGPGMWSEKWGWKFMRRGDDEKGAAAKPGARDDGRPPPPGSGPAAGR